MAIKPRSRRKQTGRMEKGTFTAFPHALERSPNWQKCGGTAIKLLHHLAGQYNGFNNGDFSAPLSAKPAGINSSDTLNRALLELEHYGLIIRTRQGGKNLCSLFAVSWRAIDDCHGKLEVASTITAPGTWKEQRAKFKSPPKKKILAPESGGTHIGFRRSALRRAA